MTLFYDKQELRQGMILHYEYSGKQIVHRAIAVEPVRILMKGDNNKGEEIINRSNVRGILIATVYE